MEMVRIVAWVALIGAVFVMLWKKDSNEKDDAFVETLTKMPDHIQPHISVETTFLTKWCDELEISRAPLLQLKTQLAKKIVGLDGLINALIVTLLVNSHALIEGVPGLAKTKTIATLAHALDLSFRRIQFTADMLPSDITGVEIYNSQTKQFEVQRGPVFAHIVLADEINRATPKVQSALLEAMQEQQVTIGNETLQLPHPFFVLATQNPIEQEGTYNLPEAQIDRFLMKILVNYPSVEQEQLMLSLLEDVHISVDPVLGEASLLEMQQEVATVILSDELKNYIVRIVDATRKSSSFHYGASPRASFGIMLASKAVARLAGRNYVTHEDVQRVLLLVLRHRVILTYEAQISKRSVDELLIEVISGVSLT